MTVLDSSTGDWWHVEAGSVSGWAPASFLQVQIGSSGLPGQSATADRRSRASVQHLFSPVETSPETHTGHSKESEIPSPPPPPPVSSSVSSVSSSVAQEVKTETTVSPVARTELEGTLPAPVRPSRASVAPRSSTLRPGLPSRQSVMRPMGYSSPMGNSDSARSRPMSVMIRKGPKMLDPRRASSIYASLEVEHPETEE